MYPKISIITPAYNAFPYIKTLIESVLLQNYPNFEHIIIDDGSTDNGKTKGVLSSYDHLIWWSRKNKGQYPTMNEGFLKAKGDIFCFISADDEITPNTFWNVKDYFDTRPGIDGLYGNYSYIDSSGKRLPTFQLFKNSNIKLYPYSYHVSHSSLYLKRSSIIDSQIYFNEQLRYVGDYDWITRLVKAGLEIERYNANLSLIRVHGLQTSSIFSKEMREEIFIVKKELGVNTMLSKIFRGIMFLSKVVNSFWNYGFQEALQLLTRKFRSNKKNKIF